MKHRKWISLLSALALTLALAAPAFADDSTTTRSSASKDQKARTEIYTVTQTPGSDYPTYGAKNEPSGGVYYGRYTKSGELPNGRYGLSNLSDMAGESAVARYLELSDTYGLEYWSYVHGPAIEDNTRAFLVSLNFPGEGADCAAVNSGTYDAKLTKDFQYLNTLTCPVFVRIGGEVNVWEDRPSQSDYIAAFQRISGLVRANAPKAAVVFSPNYSSENNLDMDSYYPGDEYVDWVGCSLYYNAVHHSGDTKHDKFYGVGAYGDPLLNVQQTVNLSKLHKKPVMVTEGGSFLTFNGKDYSSYAAERMDRAFSFLTMVYPEIKCILSSDYDASNVGQGDYTFAGSTTVTSAYRRAVSSNPTFVQSWQDKGAYYTKLSAYKGPWEGTMKFAAYTYAAEKQTATWSVDGQTKATVSEYPYAFSLDVSALSSGSHTIKVTFGNGASKSYDFRKTALMASPTDDTLSVDGVVKNPTIYKINDSNYFKLRDVAMLLSGTEKQFAVYYDASLDAVQVATGQAYTPNGSELSGAASGSKEAAVSSNAIYINGVKADGLTAYEIDGSNYFKLRDLGKALDFYVGWDAAAGVTVSGSAGYQE